MNVSRSLTAVIVGVTAHTVIVEAAEVGPPGIHLHHLSLARHTRDRVRAAVLNSALDWPARRLAVHLFPASLPKLGTGADVAIAAAVLAADGAIDHPPADTLFLAELGLDGRLHPVPGATAIALAAAEANLSAMVVAPGNAGDAALVPGIRVVPMATLSEVAAWLGKRGASPAPAATLPGTALAPGHRARPPDLRDAERRRLRP